MSTVSQFLARQKANSPYITLLDGESATIKTLLDIKEVTKAGYSGEEKLVLRFKCLVETSEGVKQKDFDNATPRFAQEVEEKGLSIGDGFTLTRNGLTTKTRYTISNIVKGQPTGAGLAAAVPAPAKVA